MPSSPNDPNLRARWSDVSASSALYSAVNIDRTNEAPRPRNKPRGLPATLADLEVFNLSDPQLVARELTHQFGHNRVDVAPPDRGEFEARLHAIELGAVSFAYLDVAAPCTIRVGAARSRVLVIIPASGASTVTVAAQPVPTSAVVGAVVSPNQRFHLTFDEAMAYVLVEIERSAVEDRLSRLLGKRLDRAIQFSPRFDLAAPSALRWNLAVQALHAELSDAESLLDRGVGIGQLEDFLIGSLLYCHSSNFSHLLSGVDDTARRSVRQAVDFIEGRLAETITVDEIAGAAGVSARSLQAHFKADLALTPLQYVQRRRLERIRDDLKAATPGSGVTVTDVALRWGMSHLGRFSAAYRRRFAELPSETLRR